MHSGYPLAAGLACLAIGLLVRLAPVGGMVSAIGGGVALCGLLLVVVAIANSYLNDLREGYRSASEE